MMSTAQQMCQAALQPAYTAEYQHPQQDELHS